MEEVRVESWIELQERLFADSWQESLGRFRSDDAYRGGRDAGERLVPTWHASETRRPGSRVTCCGTSASTRTAPTCRPTPSGTGSRSASTTACPRCLLDWSQYALFSLVSDMTVPLDEWLMRQPDLARRLVIRADLKWEIRDKLDQADVTERVLFPGLDGLSRWPARHYMPRTADAASATSSSAAPLGHP